jgi:integrase
MRKKTAGVTRNPDGTVTLNAVVTLPGTGKRVHVYKAGLASVAEAKEAERAIVEKRLGRAKAADRSERFESFAKEYLDHRRTQNLAEQSLEGIGFMIKKYLLPPFRGRAVADCLEPRSVYRWHDSLASAEEPSVRRKDKIFGEARMLVSFARRLRLIDPETCEDDRDILEAIRLPTSPAKARPAWTEEEAGRFVAAIPEDSEDYALFSLELWLGARKGELLGLQRKCHHDCKIEIRQQIIRAKGGWELSSRLKSDNSYRTDPLPKELDALLTSYEDKKGIGPDGFLFPARGGPMIPMSKTELARRQRIYETKAGVPHIGPHGMRHTRIKFFKEKISTAAEAQAASKFIGHSVMVDMNVYGKATDADVESFVAAYESRPKAA